MLTWLFVVIAVFLSVTVPVILKWLKKVVEGYLCAVHLKVAEKKILEGYLCAFTLKWLKRAVESYLCAVHLTVTQ